MDLFNVQWVNRRMKYQVSSGHEGGLNWVVIAATVSLESGNDVRVMEAVEL